MRLTFSRAVHQDSGGNRLLPLLVSLAYLLILPACAPAGGEDRLPENNILIYGALNPLSSKVESFINNFNRTHDDIQIEVRDYSDEGGIDRLLTELALGRVPDILELHRIDSILEDYAGMPMIVAGDGPQYVMTRLERSDGDYWLPYRQMAQGGYLEDLWPYIESDPDLGRDAVLEEPLKAAEVNGGLYMLFEDFVITTLMGPKSLVGDRTGWTLEEMMEVFSTMPPESTVLRYQATRSQVFYHLLSPSLDKYLDWGTGECFFDDPSFRDMVDFLGTIPVETKTTGIPKVDSEERFWRIFEGRQMLEVTTIKFLHDVPYANAFFMEPASFVGYPTADGSMGSYFTPQDRKLAMSSTCQNKEAAWDFMRQLIVKRFNSSTVMRAIERHPPLIYMPVNREEYELVCRRDMKLREMIMVPWRYYPDAPLVWIAKPATEDDKRQLDTLLHSTTLLYWPDDALSDIVWDAIGPYFAGDKTMDETVQLINNRVRLYLNENR